MFEIVIDLGELEGFTRALQEIPARVDAVLVETMKEAEDRGYLELSAYAEPPTYPIQWDSEKQKRAFFASDGFGNSIPHQRQGALPNSFEESDVTASEGLIEGKTYSIAEWAHWIMGKDQSSIHAGRWETDAQIAERIRPDIVQLFQAAIMRAINEGLNAR